MLNRKFPKLKLPKEIKLDAGCADCKKEGYIGIDNVDYGQEIIWDIRDGIPFSDESIDEVYTCHLLEHLTNKESKEFIEDVQRVLKTGGLFVNRLPSITHFGAYYPDHESFWNEPRVESIVRNMPGWQIVENFVFEHELRFRLKKV